MSYNPGTHLIATLKTGNDQLLVQYREFSDLVNQLIDTHGLQKLGEVYHNFSPSGFTGVVCLSESHLSIHTWPEHGIINIDIYLSNFMRTNDATVQNLYEAFRKHFNARVEKEEFLKR